MYKKVSNILCIAAFIGAMSLNNQTALAQAPVPTLDRVKAEQSTFLKDTHQSYVLTELTGDATAPDGAITVNINDKTYYYTPSDNAEVLQSLASTGSVALEVTTDPSKALYSVGDTYYTYNPDKLKGSGYNLTEAASADEPNTITLYDKTEVIKYYDPTTGAEVAESDRQEGVEYKEVTTIETTPKYYTVNLNKTQYGDPNGTTTLTYGWEKNADTGNLEFKQDPTTPVGQTITYKYTIPDGESLDRITNDSDNSLQTITGAFVNQTTGSTSGSQYGGAIYNNGSSAKLGDINADFIGNYTSSTNSSADGGAIYNYEGTIGDITGDFIGNYATSTNKSAVGGAIYNNSKATIGDITGNFISNYASSTDDYAYGGAIYNSGTIGDIAADFVGNYASSTDYYAQGGAIYNNGTIGDITGDFIGNYATANSSAYGGAIYNSNATIGNITGDFIGNYASSTDDNAYGGAIYNDDGTIGDITGDFIGNFASSTGRTADGGAISNSGTIGDITGDFIGNYASSSSSANGGAIYNFSGTIGDITGDFIGNYTSANIYYTSYGGAIFNGSNSTIGNITGDFIGNYALGYSANGGAISNSYDATIGNITGDFIGNYASGPGGAISNRETIGDITGDFIGNYASSTESYADGGAISNRGTIGDIAGDFIGNYASSTESYAYGGAIYNRGTIGDIAGDFIGNYASSTESYAYGGAIYNRGTIGDIAGDFIGNYASSTESYAYGGAIYNYRTIGNITGDFIGNYASASSDAYGGAIYNYGTIGDIAGDFIGNYVSGSSGGGGAIYNDGNNNSPIIGNITGDFIGNYATGATAEGGAIYNSGTIENITGDFISNHASTGGAIDNHGTIEDIKGNFVNNYSITTAEQGGGGAIRNYGGTINSITGDFIQNYIVAPNAYGGALFKYSGTIGETTGDFIGNYASGEISAQGGAINNNNQNGEIKDITGNFIGNYAISTSGIAGGGAIVNLGITNNITGNFVNNYSQSINGNALGGAISNQGTLGDITGDFINNYASGIATKGGAIDNKETIGNITGDFSGNYALATRNFAYGGAISLDGGTIGQLDDDGNLTGGIYGSFINNYAKTESDSQLALGGAVYTDSDMNIIADNQTNYFSGNYTEDYRGKINNAIFVETSSGSSPTIKLQAQNSGVIVFDDQIDGGASVRNAETNKYEIDRTNAYNLALTGDETGAIYLNDKVINANISLDNNINVYVNEGTNFAESRSLAVNSGVLNIQHLNNQTVNFERFSNAGTINLASVDVDLQNESMGRITADEYGESTGKINVQGVNLLNDATKDITNVLFADEQISSSVAYTGASPIAYSPIYKYEVSYNPDDGFFTFARSAGSSGPNGNISDSFNPSVLASQVATQAGAYTTQLQTFNYAFQHADTFMNIPYLERISMINAGKYALSPTGDATDVGTYSPLMIKQHDPGFWVKPYASFENVPLKNGPKVSNINYGTLIGYDSPLKTISHGFERVLTGYIGYNGASQRYSGVDAYQNGGLIGGTATFYKGNFFNATTLSVGATAGDASTMYGSENYTMLLAGIGNKTGYNFEFWDGKMILQPNFLISYTFVNTFDYNNAAGVRIESDPLHAIQLSPGLKLIGNTKNGWQPYIGVNMVWNLLDDSRVTANDVRLPEMSIRPYVQYGVGVQKRFKDKFLAFGQAMIHNGGRNGVSLTAGLRWKVGRE